MLFLSQWSLDVLFVAIIGFLVVFWLLSGDVSMFLF